MFEHVFISYSHDDSAYVDRLVEHLARAGIEVWTDKDIDHGAEWRRTIETQLYDCSVFVPVMSRSSRKAEWVEREILFALDLRKPILPLLLNGQPFLELRNIQHEDVTRGGLPSAAYVTRLRALAVSAAMVVSDAFPYEAVAEYVATRTLGAPAPRLTLHAAMATVLETAPSHMMRASELAAEINARGLYRMRDGRPVEQQQIHARVGHHPTLFARQDGCITLLS